MHHQLNRLVIYRNIETDSVLYRLADIFARFENGEHEPEILTADIYCQIHRLLDIATEYGFDQNLWQNYLAFLLATTENPFSLACEKVGANEGSVNALAKSDFKVFKELFDFNFSPIEQALQIDCFAKVSNYRALVREQKKYNWLVSEKVRALSTAVAAAPTADDVFQVITAFYRDNGVGVLGLNKAFRLRENTDRIQLEPITNTVEAYLDDLVGCEPQKKTLIENTEAFIQGKKANNLLLHGDSGTGKSTCVKAILNMYFDHGLRVIELYKHQFEHLAAIIAMIKNRNYRFIIFMDDLSFEEFETDYKYLKAVIEGGMEITPDNVLIYATSNRRHLIKETWTDRNDRVNEDDIHHSDTAEEKISLVNRFGVTIYFPKPNHQEYLEIVRQLAGRYPEITLTGQELLDQADKWAMWHGNISGRRAQQFINYLCGRNPDS